MVASQRRLHMPGAPCWLRLLMACAFMALPASAHPSPADFAGIPRSQIGLALSLVGLLSASLYYVYVGLKRSARAVTVSDYFFFDKRVTGGQYSDTTVSYSFQVVVTVYFIYWGFVYGIGVLYYAITWLLGIYLFQLAAKRLLVFALSEDTLHSFLAKRFGASLMIRRLTAFCTMFGLLGGLLIEVNYTTDLVASLSTTAISTAGWTAVYVLLLYLAWFYVQHGGYKSTVLTDAVQLPLIYLCLTVVFCFILFLAFRAGYRSHAIFIGALLLLLWAIIAAARRAGQPAHAKWDGSTISALIGAATTAVVTVYFSFATHSATTLERIHDTPDSFTFAAFARQDLIVAIGFTILNLAWQFFDMTAWQRISSLSLGDGSQESAVKKLRTAIAATKWESPVTWAFGIVFGIGLRHTGLFETTKQASDAFMWFSRFLVDNDLPLGPGIVATYLVLPCMMVAFLTIMLSTTDSFVATITFTWIHDITLTDSKKLLSEDAEESAILKRAKIASFVLLFFGATGFVVMHRIVHANVFLLLNTVYSAQFSIVFFSLGALFLAHPARYKNQCIAAVAGALVADLLTAMFCYGKMQSLPNSAWGDWFYNLPTVVSAVVGGAMMVPILFSARRARRGVSAEVNI